MGKNKMGNAELAKMVEAMEVYAECKLFDGTVLGAHRKNGAFTWEINGVPASLEEAQAVMMADPADHWTFKDANGMSFDVRRPTPAEKVDLEKKREIAAWNKAVDEKKKAKKAKKGGLSKENVAPVKKDGWHHHAEVMENGVKTRYVDGVKVARQEVTCTFETTTFGEE